MFDHIVKFVDRFDGWTNLITGLGTSRDKTGAGHHLANAVLSDFELTSLYNNDDFSQKIVDVYPREAMREGFNVKFNGQVDDKLNDYLRTFNLVQLITDCWVWARLYGGAAIWLIVEDGTAHPREPIGKIKKVSTLRVLDRRFLTVSRWYTSGPNVGYPETYNLSAIAGQSVQVGEIHKSRLIIFPGARTDAETKRTLNHWDLSVLQRPYEALRSAGNVWKGIELLVSDANQGVYKIKNLWQIVTAGQGDKLLERLRIMDLSRSVARSIALDADQEDFRRDNTTFAGLADLDERGLKRVASAAEIPIAVLMGQSFAGLNATGQADLQWFWGRVDAERTQQAEPHILELLGHLVSAIVSTVPEITIEWPPLWQPTALELAQIYKLRAEGDAVYITNEVVLPEEIALSRFPVEGSQVQINRELRETILAAETEKLSKGEAETKSLEIAPTDVAKTVTVNEVRSSKGLGPLKNVSGGIDPDGNLTVAEFEAKRGQPPPVETPADATGPG